MAEERNEERNTASNVDNEHVSLPNEAEIVSNLETIEETTVEEAFLHEEKRQKHKEMLFFIDQNPLYYERKWGKKEDPSKGVSWNFAAFFLNTFWFAYRKMYGWMFISLILSVLLELALYGLATVTRLSWEIELGISIVAYIGMGALFGLYGNTLYYRHVQKKMKQIEQSPLLTVDMKPFMLKRTGGVNKWAVGGLVFVLFSFLFVIGAYVEEVEQFGSTTNYGDIFQSEEGDMISIVQQWEVATEFERMYADITWTQEGADTVIFAGVNTQTGEQIKAVFLCEEVTFDEYDIFLEEITVNNRILSEFEVEELLRWVMGDEWMKKEEDLFKDHRTPSIIM
jgi:Protein of unknown function (DUF2628)